MFTEVIIYLSSRGCTASRKSGLVSEVAAIAGRHRRQKKAWEHHLDATKTFISKNSGKSIESKPILILGAGLCLDIPLDDLLSKNKDVVLADAIIPQRIRSLSNKHTNLNYICTDLSGFLAPFWNSKDGDEISPPTIAPLPDGDFGLVISCNLLSQLPLSFGNNPPSDDNEARLAAAIQLAHIRALEKYRCPILLITDYEREETKGGAMDIIPTVPPQLLPGEPHEKWQWHIAPNGEVAPGLDIKLNVGAWLLSSL